MVHCFQIGQAGIIAGIGIPFNQSEYRGITVVCGPFPESLRLWQGGDDIAVHTLGIVELVAFPGCFEGDESPYVAFGRQ